MVTLPRRWRILTQYYPPEIGAAPVRLHALARELVKRGLDVDVVTAFPSYPQGRIYRGRGISWHVRETIEGVRVLRLPIIPGTGRSARVRLTNYLSFTVSAALPALLGNCDVLFVESRPTLGVVALLLKWLRGIPYIYNVADLHLEAAEECGILENRLLQQIAARLEAYFLRKCWKVSTVSPAFVRHFHALGKPAEQVTFLPHGVDTHFLQPQPPDSEMQQRWCQGKRLFLYAGTHGYIYGVDTLLHAAARLRARSELRFLIVGEGPERARLMNLADQLRLSNVVFADALPYKEMPRLYSIAYASLATLRNTPLAESMRLAKILPSLSCGVPVIFSGSGESGKLIRAHRCGLVVPPESPDQFAQAIESLAAAPLLRTRMADNARQLALRHYDWSIVVDNWLAELGWEGALTATRDHPQMEFAAAEWRAT